MRCIVLSEIKVREEMNSFVCPASQVPTGFLTTRNESLVVSPRQKVQTHLPGVFMKSWHGRLSNNLELRHFRKKQIIKRSNSS